MSNEFNSADLLHNVGNYTGSDEQMTPAYAVTPILKYIPKDAVIWAPFDFRNSEFVKQISLTNKVISSHIGEGKDFFTYEPEEHWDIIISNPPFCFDGETEILTEDGWKNVKEINNKNNVLTLDTSNQTLEYSRVSEYKITNYKGKMYEIKSKYLDMLITPNHRMVAYDKSNNLLLNKENDLYSIETLPKSNTFMPLVGYKYNGEIVDDNIIIPEMNFDIKIKSGKIRNKVYPEITIPIETWFKFFGFWLADGFVSGSNGGRNKNNVGLKQHNKNHNIVCGMLDELGLKYKFYFNKDSETVNYDINSIQFNKYMSKFGNSHDKYIPKEWLRYKSETLNVLLKWYIFGDCNGLENNGGYLSTVSERLANDLTILSIKCGKILSMKEKYIKYNDKPYKIYAGSLIRDTSRNKRCKLLPKFRNIIDFDNKVYSIEVEKNKTLVTRRNGVVSITGNSNKRLFFERALSFNKPICLLMTLASLNDKNPAFCFYEADRQFQLLKFDKRIHFINQHGEVNKKTTFSSGYFCSDFLPKDLILEELITT